jgi:arginyl-tRNA synthetase
VQYAHARCRSILRNAQAAMPDFDLTTAALSSASMERLDDEGELAIIQRLAQYPRLIEAAAQAHEPHRVAFFLYELASDFHSQWNRGKDSPHLRFIMENDRQMTAARLALVQGIVTVLRSGLAILGVEAVEEMR